MLSWPRMVTVYWFQGTCFSLPGMHMRRVRLAALAELVPAERKSMAQDCYDRYSNRVSEFGFPTLVLLAGHYEIPSYSFMKGRR